MDDPGGTLYKERMDWNPQIVEALRRLDPATPPNEHAHVARDAALPGRGWDLPDRLVPLLLAGSRFRALLHGCVGVGKSTELLRWERELAPFATVVRVDVAPTGDVRETVLEAILVAARTEARRHGLLQLGPNYISTASERFLTVANLVEQLVEVRARPVLLLLDGLDLLDPTSANAVFAPGSVLCHDDLPALVSTAPQSMVMLEPRDSRDPRFGDAWHLPPFPVLFLDGSPNEEVVRILADGLLRRLDGLDIFESPEVARRVAFASAGIFRHAVIILRSAILAAARLGRVSPGHVLGGERELRQDIEHGLREGDIDTLREVARTNTFYGAPRLVTMGAVVPYEGPERRYWLPHPLLWSLVSG